MAAQAQSATIASPSTGEYENPEPKPQTQNRASITKHMGDTP